MSPELIIWHALTLSKSRDYVSTDRILSHPIVSVPLALFHEDHSMRKVAKLELSHKLEEPIPKVIIVHPLTKKDTIIIRDAIAVIQVLPVERLKNIGDLTEYRKEKLLERLSIGNIVVDRFGKYDNISVKSGERETKHYKH